MNGAGDEAPGNPFAVTQDADALKASTARGSLVTAGAQLIKMASQFVSLVVLARLLFPADFGLLAMVYPVLTLVGVLNDLGFGQALIQRHSLEQDRVSALFWINMALTVLLTLLVAAIAPFAAWAYDDPRVTSVMIALGLMIPIGALGIHPTALLLRGMRFSMVARNEVIATLAGIVVSIACAWRGFSYWSIVFGQLTNVVLSTGLAWSAAGWRPSRPKLVRSAVADLRFGGALTGANLATYATTSGDQIIVGVMTGPVSLGLYDRSYRLVVQPLGQAIAPLSRVAVPLLSRLIDQADEFRASYLLFFRAILLLTIPLLLVCISQSAVMVEFFLGARWAPAAPIFAWICVGGLAAGIYSSAPWLFISLGRTRELMNYVIVASIINLASFALGAWLGGVVGVAKYAALFYVLGTTPLLLFGATRAGPVRGVDLVRIVLPHALAGAAAYIALNALPIDDLGSPFWRLAVATLVAYGLFAVAVGVWPAERRSILSGARNARDLFAARKPAPQGG